MQARIVAKVEGQSIHLTTQNVEQLTLRLRDDLINLDKPIQIVHNNKTIFDGMAHRTIQTISKTLNERHDIGLSFDAEIVVPLQ